MSIREQFNFYDGATVPVMTKLFDCMVKSIAIYGCELWGLYGWKKNHVKSIESYLLSKDHKFEKLNSKFCKQTLGVDKQTPVIFAKAALGRYPIKFNFIRRNISNL